jgi:hypothetical protein
MLRAALALVLASVLSVAASAVLIDGPEGSREVTPPPEPELSNIGTRGGLSAIYLGNGVVLTTNHVGAGDVSFDGTVHQPAGTSFYGQRTYDADLAYYRPEINDAVAMPEPDRMLAPGAALLGWLAVRRRRAAAAARAAASAPR